MWFRIPKEFLQGLTDNIPFCCVVNYTVARMVSQFLTMVFRTMLREKEIGVGFGTDLAVFAVFFDGKLDKNKRMIESESFRRLQYWRCHVCKLLNRRNKLRWGNGRRWEI